MGDDLMSDFSSILDLIAEQNALSGIQKYAQNVYGESNPQFAQLAQDDPRLARQMLPDMIKQEMARNKESSAFRDYYGIGQPDQNGITWNSPDVSALARMQEIQTTSSQAPKGSDFDPNSMYGQNPVDQQAQYDLTPQQTALLAIQNAQKAKAQSDQSKKVSALASLPPSFQGQAAQQLAMGGMGGTEVGAIDRIAASIANYQQAMPKGINRNSPMAIAINNRVLELNPDYDENQFKEQTKVKQDMSPGGVMGQKIAQAQTAINHLAAYKEASDKVGGVDANLLSGPVNSVLNLFKNQSPEYKAAQGLQTLAGDEVAKFISGTSGSTDASRKAQEDQYSLNQSPGARTAAAQTSIQALFSKLEPIADQYNKAYNKNITPVDLLSDETKLSLAKLGMLPGGTELPKQSALAGISKKSGVTPDAAQAELARRMQRRGQ
jgi:hypothetical protein